MIILLIFVGQAMASTNVPCNIPAEMTMQSQFGLSQASQAHDMSSMTSGIPSGVEDCCSDMSHCNMSSCFSLIFPSEALIQIGHFSHKVVYFEFKVDPIQKTSSLYRPPILA